MATFSPLTLSNAELNLGAEAIEGRGDGERKSMVHVYRRQPERVEGKD